jgi:DNA-binding protein H-NS
LISTALLKAPLPKKGKLAVQAESRLPVKFRGPKGEAWSGRGKLPQWMADAEKQGKSRDEFMVK